MDPAAGFTGTVSFMVRGWIDADGVGTMRTNLMRIPCLQQVGAVGVMD
jgi:hypothetical protein